MMETPTPQSSGSHSSTPGQPRESTWQRSTTRRFLLWFTHWNHVRKILFPILVLITILALFIAEENWRGKRNWDSYAKTLVERGEPIFYKDIIPPAIPDEQNFAAIPFLKDSMERGPNGTFLDEKRWPNDFGNALGTQSRIRANENKASKKNSQGFVLTDLMALEMSYRNVKLGETNKDLTLPPVHDQAARAKSGAALLEFLQVYDPVLNEMRQAMDRPFSRFNIDYDVPNPATVLLPHLSLIKRTCQVLKFRAASELAVGRSDRALADVLLMMRVEESIKSEPILISYLVRMACARITLSVVWEGLSTQAWTDPQLKTLQTALNKYDFLEDAILAFQGERAFGNGIYEFLRGAKSQSGVSEIMAMDDSDYSPIEFFFGLVPRGWLYMEQLNSNLLFDQLIQPELSQSEQRIHPKLLDQKSEAMEKELNETTFQSIMSHKMLARLLLPALDKVPPKGALTQAMMELGQIACAIERFRLSNKQLPEDLQALVPNFMEALPNDVVTDKPYLYRAQPEGGFLLYSLGWNEQDDGGQEASDPLQGDWVWTPY
jgi:hypothetical protein